MKGKDYVIISLLFMIIGRQNEDSVFMPIWLILALLFMIIGTIKSLKDE